MRQMDVDRVRNAVKSKTGTRVRIKRNKGRHRIEVKEGVISETYASIFVIETSEQAYMPAQVVAYSYTDVITKDIELFLCS